MFCDAASFNKNSGAWDTSLVTTMDKTLDGAEDLGDFSMMQNMFYGAASFNKNIAAWDTSGRLILRNLDDDVVGIARTHFDRVAAVSRDDAACQGCGLCIGAKVLFSFATRGSPLARFASAFHLPASWSSFPHN